jgi:hypothetical protein
MHCVNTTSQFRAATEHMSVQTRRKQASHNDRERNLKNWALILKQEFLKMSVSLQTAFAVETHLAEGQWLEEQVTMLKLGTDCRSFRGPRGNI